MIAIYMDDILIQGSSPPQVYLHAQVATLLFMVLGWSLNWEKSVSFPNQQATHLGFVLDSVSMTAPCPPVGITRLQSICRDEEDIVTVHDAECILGTMESVRSVTPFVCCTTVLSRSSSWEQKLLLSTLRLLIHLSSETTASLAW